MQQHMKKLDTDEILDLFGNKLKINKDWSFGECGPSDTGKYLHFCHRYPAKFIPQLVEKIIDSYFPNTSNLNINDPFMGSGTTIAVAITRGHYASGTDINKIAYLITKVKSTPINPELLNISKKNLLEKIKTYQANDSFVNLSDTLGISPNNIDRINYWFSEENTRALAFILKNIKEENDDDIRNFYSICFSHILKNCSIWLQASTKPTRDFNKKPSDPFYIFTRHLNKMIKANNKFFDVVPKEVKSNLNDFLSIRIGDARQQPVENNSTNIVITSSPYVTSYEYADLHQLSTIWFELAEDLKAYRSEFIGTAYKLDKNNKILKSKIANNIVNEMASKDKNMAKEISSFFNDMQSVFDESYRILVPGGLACFVIGNTKLKGINILNAQVYAESLQISGFKIEDVILREIPSKILPQKRDEQTGKFASSESADAEAYPTEFIVIGKKE